MVENAGRSATCLATTTMFAAQTVSFGLHKLPVCCELSLLDRRSGGQGLLLNTCTKTKLHFLLDMQIAGMAASAAQPQKVSCGSASALWLRSADGSGHKHRVSSCNAG